jgi:fucose 4-O-acetylase-like acetyltransferase
MVYHTLTKTISVLAILTSMAFAVEPEYDIMFFYYNGNSFNNARLIYSVISSNVTGYIKLDKLGGVEYSSRTVVASSTTYSVQAFTNSLNVTLLNKLCATTSNYFELTKANINRAFLVRHYHPSGGQCDIKTLWSK